MNVDHTKLKYLLDCTKNMKLLTEIFLDLNNRNYQNINNRLEKIINSKTDDLDINDAIQSIFSPILLKFTELLGSNSSNIGDPEKTMEFIRRSLLLFLKQLFLFNNQICMNISNIQDSLRNHKRYKRMENLDGSVIIVENNIKINNFVKRDAFDKTQLKTVLPAIDLITKEIHRQQTSIQVNKGLEMTSDVLKKMGTLIRNVAVNDSLRPYEMNVSDMDVTIKSTIGYNALASAYNPYKNGLRLFNNSNDGVRLEEFLSNDRVSLACGIKNPHDVIEEFTEYAMALIKSENNIISEITINERILQIKELYYMIIKELKEILGTCNISKYTFIDLVNDLYRFVRFEGFDIVAYLLEKKRYSDSGITFLFCSLYGIFIDENKLYSTHVKLVEKMDDFFIEMQDQYNANNFIEKILKEYDFNPSFDKSMKRIELDSEKFFNDIKSKAMNIQRLTQLKKSENDKINEINNYINEILDLLIKQTDTIYEEIDKSLDAIYMRIESEDFNKNIEELQGAVPDVFKTVDKKMVFEIVKNASIFNVLLSKITVLFGVLNSNLSKFDRLSNALDSLKKVDYQNIKLSMSSLSKIHRGLLVISFLPEFYFTYKKIFFFDGSFMFHNIFLSIQNEIKTKTSNILYITFNGIQFVPIEFFILKSSYLNLTPSDSLLDKMLSNLNDQFKSIWPNIVVVGNEMNRVLSEIKNSSTKLVKYYKEGKDKKREINSITIANANFSESIMGVSNISSERIPTNYLNLLFNFIELIFFINTSYKPEYNFDILDKFIEQDASGVNYIRDVIKTIFVRLYVLTIVGASETFILAGGGNLNLSNNTLTFTIKNIRALDILKKIAAISFSNYDMTLKVDQVNDIYEIKFLTTLPVKDKDQTVMEIKKTWFENVRSDGNYENLDKYIENIETENVANKKFYEPYNQPFAYNYINKMIILHLLGPNIYNIVDVKNISYQDFVCVKDLDYKVSQITFSFIA